MVIDLAELAAKRWKMDQLREEFFTIKKGLRDAGEEPTFKDVMAAKSDIQEIQRVFARRAGLPGLYDAARCYPRVMRIFRTMQINTPHTTLAAAARRYVREQNWSKNQ